MSSLRLLLTSAGIRNAKIENALKELLGKKLTDARVVFIVTAAVAQGGHHGWLVEDINRVDQLGWKQLNILDLNGIPGELALARLREADVIYATGGNAYHLARTITTSGLAEDLLELLQRRVYVGASASSMIFARRFTAGMTALFGTDDEVYKYHEGCTTRRSTSSTGGSYRTPTSPLWTLPDWQGWTSRSLPSMTRLPFVSAEMTSTLSPMGNGSCWTRCHEAPRVRRNDLAAIILYEEAARCSTSNGS